MEIGLAKETKTAERRVALTPAACRELVVAGHRLSVQRGAGIGSGHTDAAYAAAGARLVDDAESLWRSVELIVKVKEPSLTEAALLQPGQRLFCYLHLAALPELSSALCASGATAIGFETVTDSSGGLPLLAPMSAIAGRLAAQFAGQLLLAPAGGRGVLLGGVAGSPRGRAVVLGAGQVGVHAAADLAAMGAEVQVFDLNPLRLERARALAPNVTALYAYREAMGAALTVADVVIGAVLVPGAAAPKLISRAMVEAMPEGAVLVDVAVDQGGCAETTRPTDYERPTYRLAGVVHFAVTNMPGAVPRTATEALSARLVDPILRLSRPDWEQQRDLAAGVNIRDGRLVHPAVAAALGG